MNLPALGVALLVLTMVTGLSIGMADRAYLGAERDATSRRIAVAVSERMVGDESPLTVRPNVVNATELDDLDADRLASWFPVVSRHDVRVRLDDSVVVERGTPSDGTTIRRIVLVERRAEVTRTPRFSPTNPRFTLPRRTSNVTLVVRPPVGTTVRAVRTNGRIALRNESGLDGTFTVDLSRFETTTISFEADGSLPPESVRATYYPSNTRKAVLEVTVRA